MKYLLKIGIFGYAISFFAVEKEYDGYTVILLKGHNEND